MLFVPAGEFTLPDLIEGKPGVTVVKSKDG
jgi:hypothetical protein